MRDPRSVDAARRARLNGRRTIIKALLTLPAAAFGRYEALLAADAIVNAHGGPIVPPAPVPNVRLQLADGTHTDLRHVVGHKTTALQLVFTGCTTTCPMQAAIFQRVQHILPDQKQQQVQLVSLSIDPERDSPAALRQWLGRFAARPGWIAAVPRPADLARVLAFFAGSADTLTAHATEVQIIDPRGRLVWRTNELPSAQSVANLLQRAAGASAPAH